MTKRCGYQVERLVADDALAAYDVIRKWANSSKSAKQVLLYYRGHVYVDGLEAYLAAGDCNPHSPKSGGIPVTDVLRLMANCGVHGNAFLVLDVGCDSRDALLRSALQAAMLQTRANGNANETSVGIVAACFETDKLVQAGGSLLVTLLKRGLPGEADSDFDGIVSFGETHAYASAGVTDRGGKVLLLTSGDDVGLAELSRERPITLEEMIDDLADKLAAQLHESGIKLVALPDLAMRNEDADNGSLPGSSYGSIARLCTEQLRSAISARSRTKYELVGQRDLLKLLKRHDVRPETIQTEGRMEKLGAALADEFGQDEVAVLLGQVWHRRKQRLSLSCTSWDTRNLEPSEKVLGNAWLTPSDWSLTGRSAVNRLTLNQFLKVDRNRIPAGPGVVLPLPVKAHAELDYFNRADLDSCLTEIERLHQNSQTGHPLHPAATSRFPFRVTLKVDGRAIEPRWSDDRRHMYVRLKQGDTYSIWIDNERMSDVFLRLLVDGLNTLPDYPAGLSADARHADVLQTAQAVSLTRARPWNCDPGESVVAGFFTRLTGETGELRKFEVIDVADSEAGRRGYHENVGVITAAFYAPMNKPAHKGPTADLATRLGKADTTKVLPYRGNQVPGNLLGVVHIRYGLEP